MFICDTRKYVQFCEAVFGRFLHHEPPNGDELQKTGISERNQRQMLANARAYQGAMRHSAHDSLAVLAGVGDQRNYSNQH